MKDAGIYIRVKEGKLYIGKAFSFKERYGRASDRASLIHLFPEPDAKTRDTTERELIAFYLAAGVPLANKQLYKVPSRALRSRQDAN